MDLDIGATKSIKTLNTSFAVLKSLGPPYVICVGEKTVINALKSHFPTSSIKLCYFQLKRNFWRAMGELQLQSLYSKDDEFKRKLKKLIALAFLPLNMIIPPLEAIEDLFSSSNEFKIFEIFTITMFKEKKGEIILK